jgi:LruC domain-containing protein
MKTIHSLMKATLGAVVLLATVSCTTDYYDEKKYEQYIKYNSPVDSVDQYQDWKLTKELMYRVTANVEMDVEKVLLLTANPLSSSTSYIMAQNWIAKGESKTLIASVPKTQSTLYAALVGTDGTYYVKSFSKLTTEVNFSGGLNSGTPIATPKPQTYTYIYEKDFPLCGDYDYNDLVMRIGLERTEPKQLQIHVTLAAVGCDVQVGGFIRLLGVNYNQIDSVTTADGKTFDDNLPAGSREMVNNTNTFRTGLKGTEAVITLFNDAHWAMDNHQILTENSGSIPERKIYNTSLAVGEEYESRTVVSQTYTVYFNSEEAVDKMSMESIDPFIVAFYNSARYETHLDELKAAQVMYKYNVEAKIKDLPWALLVPSADFKYPLEGVQLGFRKRTETGVVFNDGAYATSGHSFGGWVENSQSDLDWYGYPDKNSVWMF